MTRVELLSLTDGRYVVPENRWDLLDERPARQATVAVVVPYYEQQTELDLVLAALAIQDYPHDLIEVVVCDDGSGQPPDVSAAPLRCSVVSQQDKGFRAAAARNLGVRHTESEVLCFLDADTVPEPQYVSAAVRLPSVLPDALVVGRRRHADLTGWTPARLPQWWSGHSVPRELDEPRWLSDAYRRTSNLLNIDHRSYRYVISSVMCCSRELFDYCGGFDESFDRYGGEDWEFAHRALTCGAVLHHARDAVAWHNGADWAGRDVADRATAKNAEALAVARLVPDPEARVHGLRYDIPDVAVEIDAADHGPGSLVRTAACFLGQDVGLFVNGAGAETLVGSLRTDDPRIRVGPVPDAVRRRCRVLITLSGRPVLSREAVADIVTRASAPGVAAVEVRHDAATLLCRASWAIHRAERWSTGTVRFRDERDRSRLGTSLTYRGHAFDMDVVPRDATVAW
ncbi:glycosyltransferase [Mycobacterium sp. pW049]|uniref:glycosyltransferase n=1 Tax=[Mycobacterium] bulgaricum TaxID=3238985 RepID=UPI00351B205A